MTNTSSPRDVLPGAAVTGSTPRRASGPDAVTILSVYLVLLLGIPSSLTITALGSLGHPSTLWAVVATLLWLFHRVHGRATHVTRTRWVRVVAIAFAAIALISYAWAMTRGLPSTEISIADSSLVRLISLIGVLLLAADDIDDLERLRTLLRRIVLGGALLSILGIAQFATRRTLLEWVSIPGMSADTSFGTGVDFRSGFARVSATASHPLEYGVVLCVALPLALAFAMTERSRSGVRRWAPVALIAAASALSVSRSAYIGLAVGVLMLVPAWTGRVRVAFVVLAALMVGAVSVAVPGLLGAVRGLFAGIGNDASTVSRVSGFDVAGEFVSRFPVIGKGFGTMLPRYHIFDNEFLLMSVELGILGVAVFILLVLTGTGSAIAARRDFAADIDRQLAQATGASIAAGGVLMAFFDGLSFPMSAGLLFLLIGLGGAALRCARPSPVPEAVEAPRPVG